MVKKIDNDKLIHLFMKGKSDGEIASALGVSQSAVTQARQKLGIETDKSFPGNEDEEKERTELPIDDSWDLNSDAAYGNKVVQVFGKEDDFRVRLMRERNDETQDLWVEVEGLMLMRQLRHYLENDAMYEGLTVIREKAEKYGDVLMVKPEERAYVEEDEEDD